MGDRGAATAAAAGSTASEPSARAWRATSLSSRGSFSQSRPLASSSGVEHGCRACRSSADAARKTRDARPGHCGPYTRAGNVLLLDRGARGRRGDRHPPLRQVEVAGHGDGAPRAPAPARRAAYLCRGAATFRDLCRVDGVLLFRIALQRLPRARRADAWRFCAIVVARAGRRRAAAIAPSLDARSALAPAANASPAVAASAEVNDTHGCVRLDAAADLCRERVAPLSATSLVQRCHTPDHGSRTPCGAAARDSRAVAARSRATSAGRAEATTRR